MTTLSPQPGNKSHRLAESETLTRPRRRHARKRVVIARSLTLAATQPIP
jgi:hypothetical protein